MTSLQQQINTLESEKETLELENKLLVEEQDKLNQLITSLQSTDYNMIVKKIENLENNIKNVNENVNKVSSKIKEDLKEDFNKVTIDVEKEDEI